MYAYLYMTDAYLQKETRHFIRTVGDEHAEKIIAILEPMCDTRAQRIDILQDRGKLYSVYVIVNDSIEIFRRKIGRYFGRSRFILTGKVRYDSFSAATSSA